MNYIRWIIFGLVALGIIVLLVLCGANKNLRERLVALLLERKVKTAIQGLQDQAATSKAKAQANQMSAEEAEVAAKVVADAIAKQKQSLQTGYEQKGMTSDEIAERFRNLGI